MAESRPDGELVGVVLKAGRILDCFGMNRQLLSASEIANRAGTSRPTVYRLLRTMESLGWIRSAGSGRYGLGPHFIRLGAIAAEGIDVRGEARPVMERMVREIGESAYLFIYDHGRALCVDHVRGTSPVKVTMIDVGQKLPAKLGAASLVFLAFGAGDGDPALIEDDPHLARRVDAVREAGYATNDEELTEGVTGISAPILDRDGRAVAAVSVGGLSARFPPERSREVADYLKKACDEISVRLHSQ